MCDCKFVKLLFEQSWVVMLATVPLMIAGSWQWTAGALSGSDVVAGIHVFRCRQD